MMQQAREWNARRKGKADGEAAYPAPQDSACPYLIALKHAGEGRVARLGLLWKWADLWLYPAWAKAIVRQYQAEAALDRARVREDEARAAWEQKKALKNKKALQKAVRAVTKAQDRLDRAHRRAVETRARRQARFDRFQTRYETIRKETDYLQGVYATANLEHRQDNNEPQSLLEKSRPQVTVPTDLAVLSWPNPLIRWDRPAGSPPLSM
jgi:hypothetical protein